jgi:hypothetical protein
MDEKESETRGGRPEREAGSQGAGSMEPGAEAIAGTREPAPESSFTSSSSTLTSPSPSTSTPAPSPSPLAAVRLLLKETRRGGYAAELGRIAEQLGRSRDELLSTLLGVGLKVPEKAREKPVFVEHAGEIFWLNGNARGELWLNAKASKFAEPPPDAGDAPAPEKRARHPRKKKDGWARS